MGKVKKKAYWWRETGFNPPEPTSIEKAYIAAAESMTPGQLRKEIEHMQNLSRRIRPSGASNVRLTVFKDIFSKRADCGPLGAELRVRSTS